MPIKSGRLTQKERAFSQALAETGSVQYAAQQAGYKSSSSIWEVQQRPEVIDLVRRQQDARIVCDLLPLAVQTLADILQDSKAPAGARVTAAKVVMDRGLGRDDAAAGKAPHEMTADELRRAIEGLQRVVSDRSKPIIEGEVVALDAPGTPGTPGAEGGADGADALEDDDIMG